MQEQGIWISSQQISTLNFSTALLHLPSVDAYLGMLVNIKKKDQVEYKVPQLDNTMK